MLILDVDFNILRRIVAGERTRMFTLDKGDTLEIYAQMGEALFRYVYVKKKTDQDRIWYENNLAGALPVKRLSNVGEDRLMQALKLVHDKLTSIDSELKKENIKKALGELNG